VFCRRILVTLAPDCVINRFTSSEPESATGCSRRPRFAQYVTLTSTQSSARRPISPRSITTAFPAHDFSSINRIYCPANHSNFTSACFRARIQRYGYYLLQRGINCRRGVGSLSATATVVKAMPKHVEGLSLGKTARVWLKLHFGAAESILYTELYWPSPLTNNCTTLWSMLRRPHSARLD